jgi:hypothetical protein
LPRRPKSRDAQLVGDADEPQTVPVDADESLDGAASNGVHVLSSDHPSFGDDAAGTANGSEEGADVPAALPQGSPQKGKSSKGEARRTKSMRRAAQAEEAQAPADADAEHEPRPAKSPGVNLASKELPPDAALAEPFQEAAPGDETVMAEPEQE